MEFYRQQQVLTATQNSVHYPRTRYGSDRRRPCLTVCYPDQRHWPSPFHHNPVGTAVKKAISVLSLTGSGCPSAQSIPGPRSKEHS